MVYVMSKSRKSNKQMLSEIRQMKALILKHGAEASRAQFDATELVWRHITGLQALYFRYESGMWDIQQLKSSGEFSMTLAIGILAIGIAASFWPIYLVSAAMFGLSYYYLARVSTETRKWEKDMASEAKALIESTGQA